MKFVGGIPEKENLKNVPFFEKFLQLGRADFCHFFEDFLNLDEVRIQTCDLDVLKKWLKVKEISEIMEVPDDDTEICIVSQIMDDEKLIAYYPVVFKSTNIKLYLKAKNLLSKMAEAISDQMTLCYQQGFRGCDWFFGENFARIIVSNCISTKKYDGIKFAHLIEKMEQLSVSTFEGQFFTTGVIITSNISKYRSGLEEFNEVRKLDEIDKREWFLANGKESFFLMDHNSVSIGLYRTTPSEKEYFDKYFDEYYLSDDLHAPDFVVRTVGPNELVVSDADGKEFVKVENIWKYRHNKNITNFIVEHSDLTYRISYVILFYIMYCSRNHISSIIWLPSDSSAYAIEGVTTPNRVKIWKNKLNILEEKHQVFIEKLLASDGAIVIDKSGNIIYESVFADMNYASVSKAKLTGSGETATKLLAKNGIAIKISQDGKIKMFAGDEALYY